MSDSVENASFDVEAQRSLLATTAEAETTAINTARISLQRVILLIRSTELFKSGANYGPDVSFSSSSSAAYESLSSPDHILTQDSGIVAAFEISSDSTQDTLVANSASDEHEHNIGLQQILQRKTINEIVKTKNLQDLHNFGGIGGVAEALNTDLEKGISCPQEICQVKPSQQLFQVLLTLFHSFKGACNNHAVFLLSCAAFLSLVFGIKEEGLTFGWFNGAVLIFTVFVLVIGATIQRCLEERSQKKLQNFWQSEVRNIQVLVVRGGEFQFIRETDLEVGDIAVLRKGDQVPADGLFVSTGQALELDEGLTKPAVIDERNPFLSYGARVINGNARMLVTSTRMDTAWGEMMSRAVESADNKCKFESYLHKLSTCMYTAGLLISILIIIVLFLRYKAGKLDEDRRYRPDPKGEPARVIAIMDAIKGIITGSRGPAARVLTTLLSLSLLGIMEGMPLVISVAAIIWSRKTLAHKALERDYLACIKMAPVTAILTDKYGGLTEHATEIDKFYVGEEFVRESSVVASGVLEGLCDAIGTLFLIPPSDSESKLLESHISWAEAKLGMKRESVIEQCKIESYNGRDPLQELCQVRMVKNGNERYLHCKGPPQALLPLCSHHYDSITGEKQAIDGLKRRKLEQANRCMIAEEARVIAYACRPVDDFDEASDELNQLIFLAMISLKETKTETTREAVSTLREGGIRTILASGDDVALLETIGQNYGMLPPGSDGLVLAAEEFRAWTDEEKMDKVEKICIMGNCLPSDKLCLVKCLRERNQVVALLAQRTVDAPALKQADIGLTFGTWSSDVARESSDLSIWDGDLSFLVNLIQNGRCFQQNTQKFIQLQLIFTISSSLINFTATVTLGDAPITAVQLFWLNLVVAFVGGLALLPGSSSGALMTMLPLKSLTKPITKPMWRNIAIQALYQTTIFVTLQHKGPAILGTSGASVKLMIYNGFFLCQLFNLFIAREPEKRNIFSGLFHNNWRFLMALVLGLICQAVFAVAERGVGSGPGLEWKLWGECLLIGLVSWVLDWAGKSASNFIASWVADEEGNGN